MNNFEKNVINLYGEKGKQWLIDLPKIIEQMQALYGLTNLKPIKNLSFNYVLTGFQSSQPIVLKLGLDIAGLKREAAALNAFANFGVVKVLAENNGALLLQGAVPGISLKSYFPAKDNEAIQISCKCLKYLHQAPMPETKVFPHIKDWLSALDTNFNIPACYLYKARQMRDDLLATSSASVLLHGDLHHDNMLQNHGKWIVIDPKGVIGEPAYEVAAFIRNPMPELLAQENAENIIYYRINRFAEILKISERRIFDWCFVQAVLGWAWALEDGGDKSYFKQFIDLICKFKK